MAKLTIQILEGAERGRVYDDLAPPITIGREEENRIQLNDDRVSRFHLKIQEEAGRIILTDLGSTNGTRVNGHPVQMRVLQLGDQISVGRSLLLVGSTEELNRPSSAVILSDDAFDNIPTHPLTMGPGEPVEAPLSQPESVPFNSDSWQPPENKSLFPSGPPILPEGLRMGQSAQLTDLLAYLHRELSEVLEAGVEDRHAGTRPMQLDRADWQRLQLLQMQLGHYMRQITEP
ncbi:MAG: FHA domain-containing protein [Planctomycetaceae bacterium]|jgi:pSer/pThr/pTyr-binding forkhead associated (FHA) protein